MTNLLPNRTELEYGCYIAFGLLVAFFWLEWSHTHQQAVMAMADHCMEYSGANHDNSGERMEIYYSCLKGE